MATKEECAKRNDSGFHDVHDFDTQCDECSASTEDQLYTKLAKPVSDQENLSLSITVSKDGVLETDKRDYAQDGSVIPTTQSFIAEEENRCEPPVLTMQQPACKGQQEVHEDQQLQQKQEQQDQQRYPMLEQQLRLLQEMKIQVELSEQEMKLQELKNKKQTLERQRQREEVEHEIVMSCKLKELESIKQELCQHRAIDTFREVHGIHGTEIESGPLLDLKCHSIPANVEDSESEGQVHAQELEQYDEVDSEQKCSPVEEATSYRASKDSMVTGTDKLYVGQPIDVNKDSEQDHNFPPDFDGKGVLIAMPGTNTLQHSYNPAHCSQTYEAVLLKETRNIAPGAKFIFYHRFEAALTAIDIGILTDQWLQRKDHRTFHTFIICVPSAWNYNHELEAAIHRAQSEGIVVVCAAGCGKDGRVYPAALGCCFVIGEQCSDNSNTAYGGAIDHVEPGGSVHHKNGRIHGASISAARFTGRLALFSESLFTASGVSVNVTVLKELLLFTVQCEYTSQAGYGRVDFKSLTQRPAEQTRVDLAHITSKRDRVQHPSDPFPGDAKANTKHWHTTASLSGGEVTLAMIDDISEDYLTHIQQKHKCIKIQYKNGIEYFYMYAKDVMQNCCITYHKDSHILQCGAIIANTSPNCRLLLIKHNKQDDPGEEIALEVVKKERPHILLVSAVTTDTSTKFCDNLAPILSSCVVVCAAGNEGKTDMSNTICYPARAGNLIVIGACDRFGNRCAYSSVGRELSLLCPGQFDVADSEGRGATCYAAAAAGTFIAQFLQLINTQCKGVYIKTMAMQGARREAISDLVCNTHLMKRLLCNSRMGLCCRAEHSPTEGYGMLQIDKLSQVTRELIIHEVKRLFT